VERIGVAASIKPILKAAYSAGVNVRLFFGKKPGLVRRQAGGDLGA
jgi:hypothetical protein